MNNQKWAIFLLRLGLAIAFVYPSIAGYLDPIAWSGFIPYWIKTIVPGRTFLLFFAVFEMLLAFWLLSGKKTYWASLVSAALMFLITVFNLSAFEIVFRDISLGLAALALALLTKQGLARS